MGSGGLGWYSSSGTFRTRRAGGKRLAGTSPYEAVQNVVKGNRVILNIGGNNYRLVAREVYKIGR